MVRTTVVGVALVMCTLLVPRAALAQQAAASGIAGVVERRLRGRLPGVTVEAASPALIEKVRTVVTDGEGRLQHRRSAARRVHGHIHTHRASARSGATASS